MYLKEVGKELGVLSLSQVQNLLMTLGKLLCLFEPKFPHINEKNIIHFLKLSWGINGSVHKRIS